MKLFLDDIRQAPKGFIPVRNAHDCIFLLKTGEVTDISFDHDLGEDLTGYDVAKWVETNVEILPPISWFVHSMNPVGRENITRAMLNADKVWFK